MATATLERHETLDRSKCSSSAIDDACAHIVRLQQTESHFSRVQHVADGQTARPGSHEYTFWRGAGNVGTEVGKGALNEVTHHYGRVAASAAIGFGIGLGTAFLAPEIAIGLGIAGIGYTGYQLYKHIPGWVHDAKVVADPASHNAAEVEQAKHGMQDFGAGAVDVGAGIAGGYVGSRVGGALVGKMRPGNEGTSKSESAETKPAPAETKTVSKNGKEANIANASAQQQQSPDVSGAAQGQGDPTQAAAQGANQGDPTQGNAQTRGDGGRVRVGGDKAPRVVKPETAASGAAAEAPLTVEQSVANNQSVFSKAADTVIAAKKQAYNVQFTRIEKPTLVPTLENPAGQTAEAGQWIATRLNADGTPVMENGMVNQWPVKAETILKTYRTTPEQLQNSTSFIAGTKTDAPPVHMVQLKQDMTIMTKWGEMKGKVGDWLANYDYDAATQKAGENYAIVSKESFKQTYERWLGKLIS